MIRILVTGAGGTASRNFIDSLRMAPEAFHVVGTDASALHLQTAPVDARYRVPRCDDPAYLDAMRAIVHDERVALLHVQPDPEVAFWAEHRDAAGTATFLPDAATIRRCQDKSATREALAAAGVAVPRGLALASAADLEQAFDRLADGDGRVWLRAVRGAGSRAALPVQTPAQAEQWMDYWASRAGLRPDDFMVSEFLPGREFAFQSVWHDGRLVTSMARERQEYLFGSLMPSGQSSSPSVARTVHEPVVNEVATRAVRAAAARPHGVFCVDLKENADGVPCVTEINAGRFFTTSNFFSAAGSNMPWIYVQLALGRDPGPQPRYDAVPPDLYWVRGVDCLPTLIDSAAWTTPSEAS